MFVMPQAIYVFLISRVVWQRIAGSLLPFFQIPDSIIFIVSPDSTAEITADSQKVWCAENTSG